MVKSQNKKKVLFCDCGIEISRMSHLFDNTTVVCLLHHLVVEPLILGNSTTHTGTAYAKIGDYILGVVFHPKPSSVSDVAGIQSVHASLNWGRSIADTNFFSMKITVQAYKSVRTCSFLCQPSIINGLSQN